MNKNTAFSLSRHNLMLSPLAAALLAGWLCCGSAFAEPAAVSVPNTGEPSAERPLFSVRPGRGLTLDAGDVFGTSWRMRVQFRNTVTAPGPEAAGSATNESQVKTLRLYNLGHLFTRDLTWLIQLAFGSGDFESDSSSPIFDAFIDYKFHRDVRLRAGQFFVPFDRARTIREFALQFVERQNAVRELGMDRDMGLMLWSEDLFGLGWLGYHLFLATGDGRNRVKPSAMGPLVIGRLVVRPFGVFDDDQEGDLTRQDHPRLAIGVAGGYNHDTSRARSTHGATLKRSGINYIHAAADVVFKYRGLSVLAEGIYRRGTKHVTADAGSDGTPAEYSRSAAAYLAHIGYMLDDRWEMVARWEQLFAIPGTDPELIQFERQSGKQLAAGVNCYLNGHAFKLQSDYSLLFGGEVAEANHIWRLQLDATF